MRLLGVTTYRAPGFLGNVVHEALLLDRCPLRVEGAREVGVISAAISINSLHLVKHFGGKRCSCGGLSKYQTAV